MFSNSADYALRLNNAFKKKQLMLFVPVSKKNLLCNLFFQTAGVISGFSFTSKQSFCCYLNYNSKLFGRAKKIFFFSKTTKRYFYTKKKILFLLFSASQNFILKKNHHFPFFIKKNLEAAPTIMYVFFNGKAFLSHMEMSSKHQGGELIFCILFLIVISFIAQQGEPLTVN
jgi:ribosomal protein S8